MTQKYADFSGRARRAEYWTFVLINWAIAVVLVVLAIALAIAESPLAIIPGLLYLALLLGTMVPTWALIARRLHDTGKSGWTFAVGFIPIVGGVILLVFLFTDGDRNPNQYGPSPKYGGTGHESGYSPYGGGGQQQPQQFGAPQYGQPPQQGQQFGAPQYGQPQQQPQQFGAPQQSQQGQQFGAPQGQQYPPQ